MGLRVNEPEHGVLAAERGTSVPEHDTSVPERDTSADGRLAVGTGEPGGLAADKLAADRPAQETPVVDR